MLFDTCAPNTIQSDIFIAQPTDIPVVSPLLGLEHQRVAKSQGAFEDKLPVGLMHYADLVWQASSKVILLSFIEHFEG
jgi:hypothetical protein